MLTHFIVKRFFIILKVFRMIAQREHEFILAHLRQSDIEAFFIRAVYVRCCLDGLRDFLYASGAKPLSQVTQRENNGNNTFFGGRRTKSRELTHEPLEKLFRGVGVETRHVPSAF